MVKWEWLQSDWMEDNFIRGFASAMTLVFPGIFVGAVLDTETNLPWVIWVSCWLLIPVVVAALLFLVLPRLSVYHDLKARNYWAMEKLYSFPRDQRKALPKRIKSVIRNASEEQASTIMNELSAIRIAHLQKAEFAPVNYEVEDMIGTLSERRADIEQSLKIEKQLKSEGF